MSILSLYRMDEAIIIVAMYIRKATRRYKDKTYTNYLLVESHTTAKGPRQKVVCSLGDLSPRPREAWLKIAHRMQTALGGQATLFEESPEVAALVDTARKRPRRQAKSPPPDADEWVRVSPERVSTERVREGGPVHVGFEFWKRLGFDEALSAAKLSARVRTLTCAMVLNRLIHPASELAMPDWIRRTALDDVLGVDFETLSASSLYRTMDRVYSKRAVIESVLVEHERNLFNLDTTVYLYDLTSTYFEGQALRNPKAKRGYSRDKRPDCKQVVVGLVINRDGFPQAHEIFEGNTQDRASLGPMLERLDARVGLKRGETVVVDRGMAFDENLAELQSRGLHYVVASRQSERDRWLAAFEDLSGFEELIRVPSPRNRAQKKSKVQVKLKRTESVSYVLCLSEGRAQKDRAIREQKEKRLLGDLEKLQTRIDQRRLVDPMKIGEAIGRLKERYPRVARYYDIAYDTDTKRFTYTANEPRRHIAEQLDGSYVLKTDRSDLSADEAWRIYSLLSRAENAFRSMKSPLAERPIFHQIERRVETHIFLCVLAYHLLVAIEQTLLDQGVHTSWATVRETLKTHQVCTVVLPTDRGSVLRIRQGSTSEPEHKALYKRLGVTERIIRAKRTWSDAAAE